MSRRVETTERLRSGALAELLDVGPRALTHAGIARRAFYSTAAAYQRWPDRRSVLDDLLAVAVVPALEQLLAEAAEAGSTLSATGRWLGLMTAEDAQPTVQAVAEMCFAARDDEALAPAVVTLVQRIISSVPVGGVDEPIASGLRWWCAGHVLGHSLLARCGCVLPALADRIALGVQVGWSHYFDVVPVQPGVGEVDQSIVPGREEPEDSVAAEILAASRRRIVTDGVDAVSLRAASADAGVTTGALYRRWASRSALLRSIVAQEGLGDQYRWLLELLVNASNGFDSAEGEAALHRAASVAKAVWANPESRTFLLEMAVAAHTSREVCERLAAQVHAVVTTRAAEVSRAADAGLVNGPLTPLETTWLLQTPPVALRLMSAIGIEPSDEEYRSVLRLVAAMIWADG